MAEKYNVIVSVLEL